MLYCVHRAGDTAVLVQELVLGVIEDPGKKQNLNILTNSCEVRTILRLALHCTDHPNSPFFWSELRVVCRAVEECRNESIDGVSHDGKEVALPTAVLQRPSQELRVSRKYGMGLVHCLQARVLIARS